jgi:hypothetical protein
MDALLIMFTVSAAAAAAVCSAVSLQGLQGWGCLPCWQALADAPVAVHL